MPCISGQYDPDVGVLLQVAVLPGGHLNQAIRSNSEKPSVGVMGAPVSGLLDTGADHTCVSQRLAQSLNLRPSGKVPVSGATGVSEMNQYMIDLLLQFGQNSIAITEHMGRTGVSPTGCAKAGPTMPRSTTWRSSAVASSRSR